MTEIVQPGVLHHKPKRKVKPLDIILFIIIAAILIFLGIKLFTSLSLKNEVSGARTVSDKVVAAIVNKDADAARDLGDANFKNKNSSEGLKQVFTGVSDIAKGTPTITRQTVDKSGKNDTVYIIYKYANKTPYYVRIGASHESGKWYLANISGSTAETNLIVK